MKKELKKISKNTKKETTRTKVSKTASIKKVPNNEITKLEVKNLEKQINPILERILSTKNVASQIADEVAKKLRRKSDGEKKNSKPKIESPIFLDTSAIIDGRIFDLVKVGVFYGNLVLTESVLSELKNIADSKDDTKKERGRRALKYLDEIKKEKNVKLITLKDQDEKIPVDDKVIQGAKRHKGRIITCDYNLSKKAKISGVISIDIHEVANILKTQAIPGESFWVKVIQKGKGDEQGVGYLPDGTMIVVEKGEDYLGKTVQVKVSRIIQTDAGKILFARMNGNNG